MSGQCRKHVLSCPAATDLQLELNTQCCGSRVRLCLLSVVCVPGHRVESSQYALIWPVTFLPVSLASCTLFSGWIIYGHIL